MNILTVVILVMFFTYAYCDHNKMGKGETVGVMLAVFWIFLAPALFLSQ